MWWHPTSNTLSKYFYNQYHNNQSWSDLNEKVQIKPQKCDDDPGEGSSRKEQVDLEKIANE